MTYILEGIDAPTRATAANTMRAMAVQVRQAVKQPACWETARGIAKRVPPRDEVRQALAVRDWIKRRLVFVKDPTDTQLLTSPLYMLSEVQKTNTIQGDCADVAMLAAALCMAVGIRCFFVAVAFNTPTAPFSHVFAVAEPRAANGGQAKVELDVTRPDGVRRAKFSRYLRQAI